MAENKVGFRVAVVGACASGKSTLVEALKEAGYEARHVAQEHSYVPTMWQRISKPDVLIYLDVDYESIQSRRPKLDFRPEYLAEQNDRLAHARRYCHLYVNTSELDVDQVLAQALTFIEEWE